MNSAHLRKLAAICLSVIAGQQCHAEDVFWKVQAIHDSKSYHAFTCYVLTERMQRQPAWDPLSKTAIALSPEKAAAIAFDSIRQHREFQPDLHVSAIRLERCPKPYDDRWFYSIHFSGNASEPKALSQVFVLLDGRIAPAFYREPPSP